MKIISHSTFDAHESGSREFMRAVKHLNHGPNSLSKRRNKLSQIHLKNVHDFVCALVCAKANDRTMVKCFGCDIVMRWNHEINRCGNFAFARSSMVAFGPIPTGLSIQKLIKYQNDLWDSHFHENRYTEKKSCFVSRVYIDRRKESFVLHRTQWSDRYFSPFATRFFIKLIVNAAASISFNAILMFFSVSNGKTFSVTFFAQIFNVCAGAPPFHLHLCAINLIILKMRIDCA